MAAAVPGLGRDGDPTSKAIARALSTTAAGRLSSDERAWAQRIEARRREVADLSGVRHSEEVGVFDIRLAVQWMSVPAPLGRLLMRLVRELESRSCLELGTGFGTSAAYLAAALQLNRAGLLITVDIDPRPAAVAREGFDSLGLERVEIRAGDGEGVLAAALADSAPLEFAFVDGDHREAAPLEALRALLPHLAPGAVIVFDDVTRSWPGMDRAWRAIEEHERVRATRHLGRFGIAAFV